MSVVPPRDGLTSGGIADWMSSPRFDRVVAAVACIPFALSLAHEMRTFGLNPAWIFTNANFVLLVLAMLVRRPPVRVTPQPLFWLLAFVATYWLFIMGRFATAGFPLAPSWLILALSFASFVVSVWARFSLGRSIGLVPAQRGLVTHGAYRYMRHPIYTGIYFSYTALALQNFSFVNAAIFAAGAALFVIKSFVEEDFLRQEPEYAAYMSAVPWRWLPGIV
jgi:protein-S-isoprenylcysteine O-methyltransferase Ste14